MRRNKQKLCNIAKKTVVKGKCIAMLAYFWKGEKVLIKNLNTHLKTPGEETTNEFQN